MIDRAILEAMAVSLHRDASACSAVNGRAFSLGFWTSEGRRVAVVVEETGVEGMFRVSDGGESWSELMMAGYTDARPTRPEQDALTRLCQLHSLHWDVRRTDIFCVVPLSGFADAAHRVTAAALAVDGWKAWYPDLVKDPNVRATVIVRELVQLAPKAKWDVEAHPKIHGRLHAWTPGAKLQRPGRAAAVSFFHEQEPERVLERALAQIYDMPFPIVCVVPERTAKALVDAPELGRRAMVVPRLVKGTAELVIEAAEQIAAAA